MFRNALDKIFVDTIGGAKSVGEVRFAMYSVVNTVMRALSERSEFCDEVNISDILRRIDSISVNTDMDELRDAVEEAFGIVFAESGNSLHTERGDDAAERAKKYIDEQYADPNLTATLIADECGISAAYLSTCFKKKYSTGLLEYINGVRIDHAKRILENDDYTVEQVITMVGYSNRRSFYRMFSRYVGITPNKYRAYVMADKKITYSVLKKLAAICTRQVFLIPQFLADKYHKYPAFAALAAHDCVVGTDSVIGFAPVAEVRIFFVQANASAFFIAVCVHIQSCTVSRGGYGLYSLCRRANVRHYLVVSGYYNDLFGSEKHCGNTV